MTNTDKTEGLNYGGQRSYHYMGYHFHWSPERCRWVITDVGREAGSAESVSKARKLIRQELPRKRGA